MCKLKMMLICLFLLLCTENFHVQAQVTECDRLAAHPSDPDKLTEGVVTPVVMQALKPAIAACEQAVAADPENPRLNYQLGRVLFYNQEYARGFRHVEKAATLRHRQAQFVAGLIYADGQEGFIKPDPCRSVPLWQDAADRGHYAAEVSLSRNYLRGIYDRCGVTLKRDAIIGYLESASKKTKSYYEKILVEYLLEHTRKGKWKK
jgi:TPR repeat protein